MIQQYRTKEGETLDSICYNYYGTTSGGQVEATLEANRSLNLPAYGPELPAGLVITLPDVETTPSTAISLF